MEKTKKIAFETMLKAGKMLMDKRKKITISHYKDAFDFATNVDIETEKFIIKRLSKYFPKYNILAEESGWHDNGSNNTWIVDPLDGTKNYTRGFPLFNTTMALKIKDNIVFGVIYNPATHEFYYAEKNKGAWKIQTNEKHKFIETSREKLHVSSESDITKAYIHLELPGVIKRKTEKNRQIITRFLDTTLKIRSLGSLALILAYVAQGSLDCTPELSGLPHLWDYAAGSLLIKEAGGKITDEKGNTWNIHENKFIASNGKIHDTIIHLIHKD